MEFPRLHSFPPFFTKQSNATVLENQLAAWSDLIVQWCRFYRVFRVSPNGAVLGRAEPEQPVFANAEIGRAASDEFRKEMLHYMIHKQQRAAYVDVRKPNSGVLVYWRLPVEWAAILRDYIESTGQLGSVLTVYELTRLDEAADELQGLDDALFEKAILVLVLQGRATVLGDMEAIKVV